MKRENEEKKEVKRGKGRGIGRGRGMGGGRGRGGGRRRKRVNWGPISKYNSNNKIITDLTNKQR